MLRLRERRASRLELPVLLLPLLCAAGMVSRSGAAGQGWLVERVPADVALWTPRKARTYR